MTIVLPILLFAVVAGLTVNRMTPRVWCATALWIVLVIALNYFNS